MHSQAVLSVIASLVLVGCAGSDPLNAEDSRVAFAALSATLESGAAAAGDGTAAYTGDSPAFRDLIDTMVDYDFPCMGGGKAHFSGSVQVSSEPDSDHTAVDLSTDFDSCTAEGGNIIIDGGMDYVVLVSSSAESDNVTVVMKGSLSFSGDIVGSCDIDVKLFVTSSEDESGVMYEGSICGHNAAVTINQGA